MTLLGPDISKYQAGLTLTADDWAAIGFGLARCSIGERVDPAGLIAARQCEAHGVPFAAYHFPYEISKHAAAAQAATVDDALDGDKRIRVMLDWESDGSEVPDLDDCIAVADAIEARGYRVTLLYTGGWYWQQMGSPDLRPLDAAGVGVIKSDYGPNRRGEADAVYADRGGDDGPGWSSIGGVTPTLWQYGSQVRIGNLYGDSNAYRGDPADLDRWLTVWDDDEMSQAQFDQLMAAISEVEREVKALQGTESNRYEVYSGRYEHLNDNLNMVIGNQRKMMAADE